MTNKSFKYMDLRGSNQYARKTKFKAGAVGFILVGLGVITYGITNSVLYTFGAEQAFANELIKPIVHKEVINPVLDLNVVTPTPSAGASAQVVVKKVIFDDPREQQVYEFLAEKNSPLASYARVFVKEADKNDIPWTLVAAISCKESSCGKYLAGSFNAWGITRGKPTGPRFASFSSWEEGIKAATKLISTNYRDNMNRGIQENYCPPVECSSTWTEDVTRFQEEINQ